MNKQKKWIISIIIFTILLLFIDGRSDNWQIKNAEAAESDLADIRFIFTTDLHGRITTTDYELGKEYNVGSLAKAYTLIEQAREEKRKGNSFTFDLGDALYDYTTENIYEMDPKAIQPIYKAMATIGYDAIVLGNHEFDFGYNYIMNQMKGSGLEDICVVSNLTDVRAGKSAFKQNMLISREITTKKGKKITLNVGIIGETVPILSKKRENYTGIFSTEDIISNTKKQVKQLKKHGADIIVVLAHSGFGTENPTEFSKDTSYALTKIEGVDVVLCGHEHKMFPSTSTDSAEFYTLAGVDKKTNLVNGKNLVMANDKGQSIGVVDLSLKMTGTKKEIVERKSEVRKVTSKTYANEEINSAFDEWKDVFLKASENIVGRVKEGQSLNNFLGLMEDTNTIQLLNNAKINYALQCINNQNVKYKDYPVIAASNHNRYGQLSYEDYANISGKISEANLSAIAPYNKYLFLYEINGKELKEWLEWSASAYQTTTKKVKWTDETMNTVMKMSGLKSLISEEWLDEWGNFYIFDGVDYTINPSVEPRYNYYGTKINETYRVYNITYNGIPVTDDMKFVLATESLTGTKYEVLKEIENKAIQKGINKTLKVLVDYVNKLSKVGDIVPVADHNWRLSLPVDYNFIMKLSEFTELDKIEKDWNYDNIYSCNHYTYYKASKQDSEADVNVPNLVVTSTNNENTNQDILVAVSATDSSGIKMIKYMYGNYSADSFNWQNGSLDLVNNTFTASINGIYTVYAEDNNGNKTVSKINITNINKGVLQIPYVESYTNRMTNITGTAEPEATIYFQTVNGEYTSIVDADGKFSYKLPSQCAGDIVKVYVKDKYGRTSETLSVTVKRTGPNKPTLETIANVDTQIVGDTKDVVATVFAIAGNNVYVSKSEGVAAYKKSELYQANMNIIKTKVSINADGSYAIDIPALNSNTFVKVYALDYIGRASKVNSTRVIDVAPNPPTIYSVCDGDDEVYGKIYNKTAGTLYNVTLSTEGQMYQTVTDENGYFSAVLGNMKVGQKINVYATDVVNNTARKSAVISYSVKDVKDYVSDGLNQYISMNEITNKTQEITGSCDRGEVKILLKVNEKIVELFTDKYGEFSYTLPNKLKAGSQVSVVVRKEHGGIIESDVKEVVVGKPDEPILLNSEIYNTTRLLKVITTEKCSVTVVIGEDKYTSNDFSYDTTLNGYLHEIKIKNVNSDNWVSIYATNSAGNSKKLELTVTLKAPDTPTVQSVDTNTEVITGTVDLVIQPEAGEPMIPTVSNTGTKVFAKIKGVIYEGVVNEYGTYKIKIEKQKVNTSIIIWAENIQGKGPSGIIKVKQGKIIKKK